MPATPTNENIGTLGVQQDGKVLINVNTGNGPITRLNQDGSVDVSFIPPVENVLRTVPPPKVYVSPRNEIFVAGGAVGPDKSGNTTLVRLAEDGSLDMMFHVHPYCSCFLTENGIVLAAFQSDSKLILGGYFSTDANHRSLARFNLDGTEDLSFDTTSVLQDAYPEALAVQADGKILYGMSLIFEGGASLRGFNADGTLDRIFTLPLGSDYIVAIGSQVGGKVLAIVWQGDKRVADLLRFNPDGSLDADFRLAQARGVGAVLVQPDGQILVSARFATPGVEGKVTSSLVRLRGDPVVLSGFSDDGSEIQINWKILDPTLSYRLESSDDVKVWSPIRTFPPESISASHREPKRGVHFFRVSYD